MPKRSNPFVDDYIQQTKTRVGLKQFNNNEERLRQIYEKTMKLLFQGAKLASVSKASSTIANNLRKPDKMKQLFISNKGTLQQAGSLVPHEASNKEIQCSCNEPLKEIMCTYCDVWLCGSCCQFCKSCHRHYCKKCSFISEDDGSVCVSCYK
ncbi:Apoptosis regulatory protein Siva [Eumeta japonica]|uniref:Apoptosis regulatory protein Siva n=1 Tax=Eumeta variegata TaxID=151549 RepID=A0A4C1YV70_EUMVA|nr:Apoptosis regulatory protein Siva [Eumeta japonica]